MSTEEKIVNFIKSYFSPKELEVIKQAPINNGDNDPIFAITKCVCVCFLQI